MAAPARPAEPERACCICNGTGRPSKTPLRGTVAGLWWLGTRTDTSLPRPLHPNAVIVTRPWWRVNFEAWATKIARHRGMKKAIVALARRLAVIMHRMWVDGTEFRWTREVAVA
jgi:hypothetical protein